MTAAALGRQPAAQPKSRRYGGASAQALALIALTLAVLVARRPDQFLHPYVWVEDGTVILKAYAERGLASVFEPVSGYLILATKLISLSAYKLSIQWAPEIALALTVAYTCAIIAAVAFSPTHLRWPFACAVAVLTLPVDPEVFAVSLLAFWWAGLLLILALLWDADRGAIWLRAFYVVLGGLSSPLAVTLSALFVLRALIERRRSEFVIAALAVAVAMIQAREIFGFHHVDYSRLIDPHIIRVATDKFAGYIIASPRYGNYYSGPILLALLGMAVWRIRDRLRRAVLAAGSHLGGDLRHDRAAQSARRDRSAQRRAALFLLSVHHHDVDHDLDRGALAGLCAHSAGGRVPARDRLGVQAHDAQS